MRPSRARGLVRLVANRTIMGHQTRVENPRWGPETRMYRLLFSPPTDGLSP
jgi:hypothetical protein